MIIKSRVLVIGAGIFGTTIAIELKKNNIDCVLVEKNDDIFSGASGNNTGRVHLGYHYPRDIETAVQSFQNAKKFSERFQNAILRKIPNNYYIVNDEQNLTSVENFEEFCKITNLPIRSLLREEIVDTGVKFDKIEVGFQTQEELCDLSILSKLIGSELKDLKIPIYFGHKIQSILNIDNSYEAKSTTSTFIAEKVIVCTYMQSIGGMDFSEYKYENTLVPLIKLDYPKVGNTLIDGPFCSVLPYGKEKDLFSIYSVPYSRIEKYTNIKSQTMKILDHVSQYFNNISDGEIVKTLKSQRAIDMRTNNTAKRTSEIIKLDSSGDLILIQSGKLDHVIAISQKICEEIRN